MENIANAHAKLTQRKLAISDITTVWGARALYLHDPEGHRIELWQADPQKFHLQRSSIQHFYRA